jgi:signal transduction histidine kinase
VQARDPSGEWGESASQRLLQEPRFRQTKSFMLILVLAISSLVVAIYRWHLHTVHVRYGLVLEERNRIGREWHDTLVAGFSAISLQLEAAMARLEKQPERAAEILDITRKMVHHYRAEARRVIWDLRDSRPEGESLGEAVNSAFARMKATRGVDGRVTVTGQPVDLPPEMQHNLLRICQEAMSNAVRHGHPSRVDIELMYQDGHISASVRDDGCGFSVEESSADSGHFGLTVMEERARRIGGQLRIASRPGEGTIIEADVPLERN